MDKPHDFLLLPLNYLHYFHELEVLVNLLYEQVQLNLRYETFTHNALFDVENILVESLLAMLLEVIPPLDALFRILSELKVVRGRYVDVVRLIVLNFGLILQNMVDVLRYNLDFRRQIRSLSYAPLPLFVNLYRLA